MQTTEQLAQAYEIFNKHGIIEAAKKTMAEVDGTTSSDEKITVPVAKELGLLVVTEILDDLANRGIDTKGALAELQEQGISLEQLVYDSIDAASEDAAKFIGTLLGIELAPREETSSSLGKTLKAVKDAILTPATEVKDAVVEKVSKKVEVIEESVEETKEVDEVEAAFQAAEDAENAVEAAKEEAKDVIGTAKEEAKKVVKTAKDAAKEAKAEAKRVKKETAKAEKEAYKQRKELVRKYYMLQHDVDCAQIDFDTEAEILGDDLSEDRTRYNKAKDALAEAKKAFADFKTNNSEFVELLAA